MPRATSFFFVSAGVLSLALLPPCPAAATGPTSPPVNFPLSIATGDQSRPTIVSDGAGGAIVTWQDGRGGGNYDIYAQRVSADGTPQWTTDGVALCTAVGFQSRPTIASDGAGGAIVTWTDYRNSTIVAGVYAQRISGDGKVQWTVDGVALCTAIAFDLSHPTIVADGSGGAIVTWTDGRGDFNIYAQRVSADGTIQWATNGVALCTATGGQSFAKITSDGAGGAIVAWWQDYRSSTHIAAQRVSAGGAVQWSANGVAVCTATGNWGLPMISPDGAGGAIVTWGDSRSGNPDVYAQRIAPDGTPQWPVNGVAVCTAVGGQEGPIVVADGSGGGIITWSDSRSGTADIYAQRVSVDGAPQWTTGGVALCTAAGNQTVTAVTPDGAGGAVVSWQDARSGTADIYAQRVSADGTAQWTTDGVALCTAIGAQTNPTITSDGAGGAIATWEDLRSGDIHIYAQRASAGGMAQWTTDGVPVCTAPFRATIAVVPDEFPTIQAGIDSYRDTVFVRPGQYAEDLHVCSGVVLRPLPPCEDSACVQVGSLSLNDATGCLVQDRGGVDVRGFRFSGGVEGGSTGERYYDHATFDACRLESGLALSVGVRYVSVHGCTILNGLNVYTDASATITDNMVLGGGVHVRADGEFTIRGNYVNGPADYGIWAWTNGSGPVDSNTVVGADVGVYAWGATPWVSDNTIMACVGTGILIDPEGWSCAHGNLIQNCGGYGIEGLRRMSEVTGNTVLACQAGGIRLQNSEDALLWQNVVGRCGGPGIERVEGSLYRASVERNTCYLNSGPGLSFGGSGIGIANNIAYGNTGPGLLWTGNDTPTLACNDWFGNTEGPTSGTPPGSTDLAVDPLFCDLGQDDVHLSADSPLLDASGCGLIGALGQGCAGIPTPVSLSIVSADVTPDGITLTWFAGGSRSTVAKVYRSLAVGEWAPIGEVTADGMGYLRYTDLLRTTATRVGYRLGVIESGIESFYGETWVDLPALKLALDGARPNPTRGGTLTVHFTLPSTAPARVELLDVSGRRVVEREVGSLGAGRHALDLGEGQHLAPGLYLVRLTQGAITRVTRVAVLK